MRSVEQIREYQKSYRENNREKLRENHRKWYYGNHAKIRSEQADRYRANKVKVAAQGKEYRSKNRDKILKRQRLYQQKNPHVWKRNTAKYSARHPDRVRASKKKWQDAHRFENLMRAKARRAAIRGKILTKESQQRVDDFYRWIKNQDYVTCTYCGTFVSGPSVHIDHIVPLCRGGDHDPDNFCVSCSDCNQNKGRKLLSEWPRCPEKFKSN